MTDVKIHLVLDNHRAHHSRAAKDALVEHGFESQFQPAYCKFLVPLFFIFFTVVASPFNCIESVWALLKRQFY